MIAKCFIDTNVVIYAADLDAGARGARARELLQGLKHAHTLVLSAQVLREFFYAATRKLRMDPLIARDMVRELSALDVVPEDAALVEEAIEISVLDRISFWDALIVAAAVRARCSTLLTEDLNHGQLIGGVRIENPFKDLAGGLDKQVRSPRAAYRPRKGRR